MKRLGLSILVLAASLGAHAQQNWAEQAWGFVKFGWEAAQKEGRSAADRVIKQFPDRFKNVPQDARKFMVRWEKQIAALNLEDRKRLALELWRIRGSLNLLSLASPATLRMIGVDVAPLEKVSVEFTKMSEGLIKKWPELKKP
jgi:hypothetical protein